MRIILYIKCCPLPNEVQQHDGLRTTAAGAMLRSPINWTYCVKSQSVCACVCVCLRHTRRRSPLGPGGYLSEYYVIVVRQPEERDDDDRPDTRGVCGNCIAASEEVL